MGFVYSTPNSWQHQNESRLADSGVAVIFRGFWVSLSLFLPVPFVPSFHHLLRRCIIILHTSFHLYHHDFWSISSFVQVLFFAFCLMSPIPLSPHPLFSLAIPFWYYGLLARYLHSLYLWTFASSPLSTNS